MVPVDIVVKVVEKVLADTPAVPNIFDGGVRRVVLPVDDPALVSVVGEIHKARPRMALAKSGIVLDFRPSGDVEISRIFTPTEDVAHG
jgi:hypothetical protein